MKVHEEGTGPRGSIILLISNLGHGGAERQAVYLALGLKAHGWDVTVASMVPILLDDYADWLARAGIFVEFLQQSTSASPKALLAATAALTRLVWAERPNVLLGWMPHGAILARVIGTILRVPRVITSLRNMKSTHAWHDWVLALTRWMDHGSITNSAVAAEVQLRAGVTTPSRSAVIANGLDMRRASELHRKPRSEGGAFLWLNIANPRHEKDHRGLLAAAKILAKSSRFRLVIAGDGPLLEELRRLNIEMGLDALVEFVGHRKEVFDLIEQADAMVLSSIWEGLPNGLIEAHAGGLPIVTTDVGGCREVVQDGVSGYLVPPSQPETLAAAMQRMMDLQEEERRAMGEAGRAFVLATYGMENMVSKWDRRLAS